MSVAINTRRATPSDFAFIVESNIAMALDTEALALDETKVRAGVGAVLADSSLGFYLVAEIDGNPAGQLMVDLRVERLAQRAVLVDSERLRSP